MRLTVYIDMSATLWLWCRRSWRRHWWWDGWSYQPQTWLSTRRSEDWTQRRQRTRNDGQKWWTNHEGEVCYLLIYWQLIDLYAVLDNRHIFVYLVHEGTMLCDNVFTLPALYATADIDW